jgi:hypothetical protein
MKTPVTAPQASRRALLMGFAAAATPMAPALAKAPSEPTLVAADRIFDAIDRHRAGLQLYDAAHAQFEEMNALYPRETEPDEFSDWSIEQRLAWRDAEIARRKGGPRDIAYECWNDRCDELNETTEKLVGIVPTTAAGIAAALEYCVEFSARISDDSEFDFLELDCCSRLLTNVIASLRNIASRGQA